MKWYLGMFKKYATFSGRARRKEFWMAYLFNVIVAIIFALLSVFISETIFSVIMSIYSLAIMIPMYALIARRLHDIGKAGKWFFISFIPLIGVIWFFVLLVTEGERGDNQYGPSPKTETYVGVQAANPQPIYREDQKKFCTNCGKPLQVEWNSCPYCKKEF
ncbi:DUF805 domain-containing protein [Lachnospiraceae bacterium ZAX-1]